MREEQTVLSPSQVALYIKQLTDRDRILSAVLVRGEISNYRTYPSGHQYFTLKDAQGALSCVMFKSDAMRMRFRPENGMQVIAAGRVSVFPKEGKYQLYCVRLTPEGAGDLHVAFEQLKDKLARMGMFEQSRKRPLPAFPGRIALITSPAGAAVRDMIRILGARWPLSWVRVLPVRVQGEGSAEEIAAAIRWCNWQKAADLIITGRGGGSMEDLWAFNEEVVARAIYESEIPVVSAVGHEPDFTIADFVADLRAATPSNGAELSVPDQNELYGVLLNLKGRMETAMKQQLERERKNLAHLAESRAMTDPTAYFQNKRILLDHQTSRLLHGMERSIGLQKQKVAALAASLDAMSPLKVLGRGYAIARTEQGKVLTRAEDTAVGERLTLRLAEGALSCRVEKTLPVPEKEIPAASGKDVRDGDGE